MKMATLRSEKDGARKNTRTDPVDPNREVKEEVDTNPFQTRLSVNREAEYVQMLEEALNIVEQMPRDAPFSGGSLVVNMIRSCGELAALLGYEDMKIAFYQHGLAVSRCCGSISGEAGCLAELVAINGLKESDSKRVAKFLNEASEQNVPLYNFHVSLALNYLNRGQIAQAMELGMQTYEDLSYISKNSTNLYLIRAQLLYILGCCRCSFDGQTVKVARQRNWVATSCLTILNEAYRYSVQANERAKVWGSEFLFYKAGSVRAEILQLQKRLYLWRGLPQEMSLYNKLMMQDVESLGAALRGFDALLDLVEVDLRFDDFDQSYSKFLGFELELGPLFQHQAAKLKSKATLSTANVIANSASPLLHRLEYSLPSFLRDVNISDNPQSDYFHSQKYFEIVALKYLTLKGYYYHGRGDTDTAVALFQEARGFVRTLEKSLSERSASTYRQNLLFAIVDCLHWQVEYYGQKGSAKELRELQNVLHRIACLFPASLRSTYRWLGWNMEKVELYKHLLMNDDGAAISKVEAQMKEMQITPLRDSSNMMTPKPRVTRTAEAAANKVPLPTRPRRRVLRPTDFMNS